MKFDIIVDNQPFEIKSTCTVLGDGSLLYKCELLGTSISTFGYYQSYEGKTHEEAVQKIAYELRRALVELAQT